MSNVFSIDDKRHQSQLDGEIPVLWKLTCGAVSGASAQSSMSIYSNIVMELHLFIVTYPLDVIRRRMQMKGSRSDLFPYTSTPNAILTMYRTEGMVSFYKGVIGTNLYSLLIHIHLLMLCRKILIRNGFFMNF